MRSELWSVVHVERAALVQDLAGLQPEQWAAASLCDGWDVHDVVAHLAATASLTLFGFAKEFLRVGFSSSRIVENQVRIGRLHSSAEVLVAFRSAVDKTVSPPQPTITRLIEIIVHGEDIRRPLRIHHEYSTSHVAEALGYLARNRGSGGEARLAGLRLCASDADIEVGTGERVEGPAVPLLVAAAGRRVAIADLSGPGRRTLDDRLLGANV